MPFVRDKYNSIILIICTLMELFSYKERPIHWEKKKENFTYNLFGCKQLKNCFKYFYFWWNFFIFVLFPIFSIVSFPTKDYKFAGQIPIPIGSSGKKKLVPLNNISIAWLFFFLPFYRWEYSMTSNLGEGWGSLINWTILNLFTNFINY